MTLLIKPVFANFAAEHSSLAALFETYLYIHRTRRLLGWGIKHAQRVEQQTCYLSCLAVLQARVSFLAGRISSLLAL
jgi:hypothetical protein